MNETILVIDDMQDVRENVSELLELTGYHVLQADDGYSGIRLAKQHVPDLILCDIMMPGIDGYGVAEILTKHLETDHIPLIYLTAKADSGDFKKGLQKGAVDYIVKPFESSELIEAISRRLKQGVSTRPVDKADVQWKNWLEYLSSGAPLGSDGTPLDIIALAPEEALFEQKDQSNHLFFIRKGALRREYSDSKGKCLCFQVNHPGEFMGWVPGFQQGSYPYSAISCGETEVLRMPMTQAEETLRSSPGIAMTWGKLQLQSKSNIVEDLAETLLGSAMENIIRTLFRFAEWDGAQWVADVPRDVLSKSTGIAYETVIRFLSQFKANGWIVTKGRRIAILDRDAMTAALN